MRILLLLPYAWDTVPGQRYRIEQWAPWLESQGVEFRIRTLLTREDQRLLYAPGQTLRKVGMMVGRMAQRLVQVRALRGVDAIWLYRTAWPIGPAILERLLARTGLPLIYEFDDAIYLPDTASSNRRWQFLKFAGKTSAICRLATHIVVGNAFLADYVRRFNPSVTVIPTTIDTDVYRPKPHYRTSGPIVVGWSGSNTTIPHLRLIDRALRLVAEQESIRLGVVGVQDFAMEGVEARAVEWRADRQVEELSLFDIGVMPLPDEEWALGKCACKALEYMGVGVPTISSPVGVNREVIRDGENGLLAGSEDEWVETILRLTRDARLRERLGRAGRATVEAAYSAKVHAPRALEVLRRVVDAGPRGRRGVFPGFLGAG